MLIRYFYCALYISDLNLSDHITREAGLSPDDVELQGFAQDMGTYLYQSKSQNTVKKYKSYFKNFQCFMSGHGKPFLPANGAQTALFLVSLMKNGCTSNVLLSYVYAIKWAHDLYSYPDPTIHPFVKNLIQTSKRSHVNNKRKKDPVSTSDIRNLFIKYIGSEDCIVVRDLALIVLAFCGFLRYDEVSNLKCSHVKFHDGYISLYIEKSKTDQYRDGKEVLISKLNSVACPVNALRRYISIVNIDLSSSNYLFKPMYKTKNKSGLVKTNKRLSYTRAKETVVGRLKEVAPNLNLGLHSLRAGGATAAANSTNVNERCWKRHGRWRSDLSKDGYVKDSIKKRLNVTKNLGL